MKAIKEAGSKRGDEVVEQLLRVVKDVKPEVPERVTGPPGVTVRQRKRGSEAGVVW